MRSGITRRWLRGSLLITVLLVLLVEVMFLYSATRSYYNGVQQTMYRRFSSITGQLKMYTGETSQKTAASRSVALRRMVEQFSDKDKYEFMLLDSYGGVIASSSGTDAEGIVTRTDFEQAQDAVDGQGIAIYRTQSGEMVMAACCLVPYAAEDVAAMRLVTSLTLVEEQLKRTVVVALIMGAAVLAFTIMSGLYFVRSIVVPLGQVERTAAGIARGELDVRLPVTGDERDEVDRLRGTINRMAEGLEETEKMKNEFISSVSHELRTPLTNIRSYAETIRDAGDELPRELENSFLDIVINESDRMTHIVQDLLTLSRLDSGRSEMNMARFDFGAAIDSVLRSIELEARRHGHELTHDYHDLPMIMGDRGRIEQVMLNVLGNAVKYTPDGGHIRVTAGTVGERVWMEVADDGIGIPKADRSRIFERFYRVDKARSRESGGTGLGLSIATEIVQRHNGTLSLVDREGPGTTVRLELPIRQSEVGGAQEGGNG